MNLKPDEFWQLSYLQKCSEYGKLLVEKSEKEQECSMLRRRVHELEKMVLINKTDLLKQKMYAAEKDLVTYRTNLAQNLNLQSLDEYIVDTETYALKHEKEL